MSYCLNPNCQQPQNPQTVNFCQSCGTRLRLKDRYRLLKPLGVGGFGRTFLAEDQGRFNAPCVIKQFSPPEPVQRNPELLATAIRLFNQEADQLHSLGKHPQIPDFFAHFDLVLTGANGMATGPRSLYLVQEWIDGDTLLAELAQGVFQEADIRALLLDILPVLQFIHAKGVIHRDIKPENIMRRRSNQRLALIDFGAVKIVTETTLARTGTVIGSAEYVAPEQTIGKAVFASDLYSLGVTCIHLLTGISPFDLWSPMEDKWVWRDFLLQNPVSAQLGNILDQMLERSLKRRYQTPTDVLQALSDQSNSVNPVSPAKILLHSVQQFPTATANLFETFSFETAQVELVTEVKQGWFRTNEEIVPKIRQRLGQAEQMVEILPNGGKLEMVRIPAGSFWMGSPNTELERTASEGPQHRIQVSEFLMGRYPVTQAQWLVIAEMPRVKQPLNLAPSEFKGDSRPVENVSWHEAVEFCDRLTHYTNRSYRLPTESEWEYACRAGTTAPFYCGEEITPDLANYNGNYTYGKGPKGKYRQKTTDVGQFPPNAFGLYDMHGNVWEWCQDTWHENYHSMPTDGRAWIAGGDANIRLRRGGSWSSNPGGCRSANRGRRGVDGRFNSSGFRVVVGFALRNP